VAAESQVTFTIVGRDRTRDAFRSAASGADRATERFRRFGRVSARVAKVAGVALGGALVSAGYALGNAAKAAAEEEQEMAVLRNTLRKATKATDAQVDATEDWITELQNATGVADGELRPALGKLVIATGDVNKAQDLLGVALDIAAARGADVNTVVTALGKAATGSTGGLSRLGLATKDASGEALTFDEILQNATKTMGGAAAAAADTTAGRFQILKARFADLKEEIGARLLPYLNRLGEWFLDDGIPALEKFGRWVRDELWPALKQFGGSAGKGILGFFSGFGEALGMGGDGANNMKSSMRNLGKALTDVVLPALGTFIEKTLPTLGRVIGELVALTGDLTAGFVNMALIGHEAFSDLTKTALNSFGAILEGLQKVTFGPLGTRVDKAAERFDAFRDKTIRALDDTEGALREVKAALDSIRSKTVTVTVERVGTGALANKPLPRAHGGPVEAGRPYIVGEKRPELFVPNKSGRIVPEVPGGFNVTYNITATEPRRAAAESTAALRRLVFERTGVVV